MNTSQMQANDGIYYRFRDRDGLEIRVRPETPADAAHLVDLFGHLGPTSRYLRFSKVMDDPDPARVLAEAERLAQLGPPRDMAWLAFADVPDEPDAPIAGARYDRLSPDTAELAISVRDDMQRRGIGSELLRFITEKARQEGIHRLVATFRAENRGVWALLKHSPYPVTREIHDAEVDAVIDLTAQVSD
jgi:RimJ/RimL family protein N-acetyltransferase